MRNPSAILILRSHLTAALAVLGAFAAPGHAEPSRGQVLAAVCAQCHGTDGAAVSGFPSLAGRSAASLYNDLLDKKHRPPEGIMDMQARGYTDEQLWLISEYFASLPGGDE